MPANAVDVGSVPGLGRFPGKGNGNPLQYFSWEILWKDVPGDHMRSQRVLATKQQQQFTFIEKKNA